MHIDFTRNGSFIPYMSNVFVLCILQLPLADEKLAGTWNVQLALADGKLAGTWNVQLALADE